MLVSFNTPIVPLEFQKATTFSSEKRRRRFRGKLSRSNALQDRFGEVETVKTPPCSGTGFPPALLETPVRAR